MAFFAGDGGAAPLIDGALKAALRRRVCELWGLGLVALGALAAAALASYDAADPSHFSAPGAEAVNWLGRPGAVLADPLMRFLGLGAWFLAAFPLAWGARFLLHAGEERIWARMLLLPLAVFLGSVFASTHALPAGWPLGVGLGGHLGDNGAAAALSLIPVAADTALRALSLAAGLAALVSWAAALGATPGEAGALLSWMGRSLAAAAGQGARAGRRLAPRRNTGAPAGAGPAEPNAPRRWPRLSLGGPRDAPAQHREEPAAPAGRAPARRRVQPAPEPAPAADTQVETAVSALGSAIRALRTGGVETVDAADEAPPAARRAEAPAPSRAHRGHAEALAEDDDDETLAADPHAEAREAEGYDAPPLEVLQPPRRAEERPLSEEELEQNARRLETVLADYGVRGEIVAVKAGPVVTLYELEPAPGLKAARVIGLADDIARSMEALSARVSTMPGRSVIGIELPNETRQTVWLRELFEQEDFAESRHALALALGKNIEGAPVVANLAKMPHLLIAGTTGSGKSVAINTMILSLLYRMSPEQCRLIMIDPKMLELSVYDGIPHLLAPVVTDPKKALVALKWVVGEMEERYRRMSKMGVRNIDGYNARVREALSRGERFERTVQTGFDEDTGEPVYETETIEPETMPLVVVIVDEMADLMMVAGKEIEACIQRLAQMARASGIHLIMATQRPSVDVITGTIKANFPTRISFQVTSKIDSRTILGEQGAEQLLGQGDMLYMAGGGRIRRVHGPFVSDDEVEEVVRHLKALGAPDYVAQVTDGGDEETQALVDEKLGLASAGDGEDALYDRAVAIVARDRKCSTSYIQRKLQIGYNKAARLVEQMEDQGVVSPANAVGKREILIEER
jgi:S-DNA-T family DNA segregation ATPase FtsK/SpoIIIE